MIDKHCETWKLNSKTYTQQQKQQNKMKLKKLTSRHAKVTQHLTNDKLLKAILKNN
jgi:hypothetical protein